jgi:hydrogenase nickel incorporation protein HypA/HybF
MAHLESARPGNTRKAHIHLSGRLGRITLRRSIGASAGSGLNSGMHELSIMQSALGLALAEAAKAGAKRVHTIRLRVGVLSGVVPDALQFAFEALSEGTLAEGGTLAIDSVPARFWCAPCAREFVSEDLLMVCPGCGGSNAELRAGRELELAALEVD